MEIKPVVPARRFPVGRPENGIELTHAADILLDENELVTFRAGGTEHDVIRKSWGYYATQSLNARLPAHGLRPVLIRNQVGRFFVFLVDPTKQAEFDAYCRVEEQEVVAWLDDETALAALRAAGHRAASDG